MKKMIKKDLKPWYPTQESEIRGEWSRKILKTLEGDFLDSYNNHPFFFNTTSSTTTTIPYFCGTTSTTSFVASGSTSFIRIYRNQNN